ncbi:hypothetical protein [Methylophaga sp.]|uniref:hypothetical protein n=1 Tax=Methylophaga sp. TaxID=2024840 RepID=UPI002727D028|nr:hypothetical protein [Methylophaga sp.]MDO8828366.1 hypothetical protein [Methylophaga sp.]
MFEDLNKALEKLTSVSIPIESDRKGFIDKQCPNEACEFLFKVHHEDWSNLFKDEAVWCPLCRHQDPADQWFTKAQVEHSVGQAKKVVENTIHNALISGADKFNRKQSKHQFLSVSMKVTGGKKSIYALPAEAVEEMELEIECESCNAHFSVIGNAFFCPCCGENSVTQCYSDAIRKIRSKKNNIEIIKAALTDVAGLDEAEITCRSILESCILDGVTAFQKYCEGLYSKYGKPPFNAFQRLDQGSRLWKDAVNCDYDDWLTNKELELLNVLFQKRHLLVHSDGIVDSKYIQKSKDNSYVVGQRIVIKNDDVDLLLGCLIKLGDSLIDTVKSV